MQKKYFGIFSKHVFTCVWQSALVALVLKIFSQIISRSSSQLRRDWVLVFTMWFLTLQPPRRPEPYQGVPSKCRLLTGVWASSLILVLSLRKYNWIRGDAISGIYWAPQQGGG